MIDRVYFHHGKIHNRQAVIPTQFFAFHLLLPYLNIY